MAKVLIHTTMTLDGFMARLNADIDWAFNYAPDEMIAEIMAEKCVTCARPHQRRCWPSGGR